MQRGEEESCFLLNPVKCDDYNTARTLIIYIELYLFKQRPQCVEEDVSRDVSDVCGRLLCACVRTICQRITLLPQALPV